MFNTYIPVAKPPTFGTSQREVADLADKIRGVAGSTRSVAKPSHPVSPEPVKGAATEVKPAAPMVNISVTQWEPLA
jgi:hypothetical protein